jgi:acyl-CoA hydrolase
MDTPSHQLSMTILMTPDTANFSGNVHGGSILKLLDQVAYACASRYAGTYVVTLSVDQVMFRQPIHVGELVNFTMVAVDDKGKTTAVPPLQPTDVEEVRRFEGAKQRRALREEMEKRHQAIMQRFPDGVD